VKRQELEHVTRAAGSVVGVDRILVIGSQSILGSYSEGDLPRETTLSNEADIAFFDDPDGSKATLLDGSIGEQSPFEQTFGYYAQGVSITSAVLPEGWRDRLVPLTNANTGGITAWCLEPHDLCIAKLAAGRSNDVAYCEALIRDGLVDVETLRERLAATDIPDYGRSVGDGLIRRADPSQLDPTQGGSGGRSWVPGHVKADGTRVKGYRRA